MATVFIEVIRNQSKNQILVSIIILSIIMLIITNYVISKLLISLSDINNWIDQEFNRSDRPDHLLSKKNGIHSLVKHLEIYSSSLLEIEDVIQDMSQGYFSHNIILKENNLSIKYATYQLNERIKLLIKKMNSISDGNFLVDYDDVVEKDHLSHTFNSMLRFIRINIEENQKQNLIKSGISKLNKAMRKAETVKDLSENIIQFLVQNDNIVIGAMYIINDSQFYELSSFYGFNVDNDNISKYGFKHGKGTIGQSASEKRTTVLSGVPSDFFKVETGLGECNPPHIVVIPIIREQKTIALLELGSFVKLSEIQISFFNEISNNIGIAISSIKSKKKMKKLYLESQSQQLALQRSNEELEQYAHVISHDLKEPLRGITGYLEYLKEDFIDSLSEEAISIIDNTIKESTRLNDMISAVLSYAKVALDGDKFETVNSEAVLAESIHNLQTVLNETKAIVTHDPLPDVFGDRGQLVQLYQNLIGNGIKYCTNEQPHVHVLAEKRETDILFSFKDNGIGIKESQIKKIFIIFERLHNKETYPGTGIGLSICKRIVERHKGEVWVESTEEVGSTFFFSIPKN